MEKDHFYHNTFAPVAFNRGFTEDERPGPVKTMTAVPSGVKSPVASPVKVSATLNTDVLKPSIKNTGIYVPTVEKPTVVQTTPKVASGVAILVPNVPGGIATTNPQPARTFLDTVKATQKTLQSEPPNTVKVAAPTTIVPTKTNDAIVQALAGGSDTGNKLAGMGLPSPLVIAGMVLAVIAFYFIAKRK